MQININNMAAFQQVAKVCEEHIECKGCPMINGSPMQTQSGQIICETGRNKKENDYEQKEEAI